VAILELIDRALRLAAAVISGAGEPMLGIHLVFGIVYDHQLASVRPTTICEASTVSIVTKLPMLAISNVAFLRPVETRCLDPQTASLPSTTSCQPALSADGMPHVVAKHHATPKPSAAPSNIPAPAKPATAPMSGAEGFAARLRKFDERMAST